MYHGELVHLIMETEMFQVLKSGGLRNRRMDGVSFCPNLKAAEDRWLISKTIRQSEVSFYLFFFLLRPSKDWMRLTHNEEGSLLYSVYPFNYYSHPDIPRIMFNGTHDPVNT